MNTKILFLYPSDKGLKSYIKVDEEIYFVTFTSNNTEAEFRVFHKDPSNILLVDSKKREKVLADFTKFLKERREDIKLGVYFADDEAFDLSIRDLEFEINGTNIDAEFSILDERFVISGLKTKVVKSETVLDAAFCKCSHCDDACICNEVKKRYDIKDFPDCLIIFEHLEHIILWLSERYRRDHLYTVETHSKVIDLSSM